MQEWEAKLYEIAGREIAEKRPIPGVWSKAFADALGDAEKTTALYLRYRVEHLRHQRMAKKCPRCGQPGLLTLRRDWSNPLLAVGVLSALAGMVLEGQNEAFGWLLILASFFVLYRAEVAKKAKYWCPNCSPAVERTKTDLRLAERIKFHEDE